MHPPFRRRGDPQGARQLTRLTIKFCASSLAPSGARLAAVVAAGPVALAFWSARGLGRGGSLVACAAGTGSAIRRRSLNTLLALPGARSAARESAVATPSALSVEGSGGLPAPSGDRGRQATELSWSDKSCG